jgi:hypothetical protein
MGANLGEQETNWDGARFRGRPYRRAVLSCGKIVGAGSVASQWRQDILLKQRVNVLGVFAATK